MWFSPVYVLLLCTSVIAIMIPMILPKELQANANNLAILENPANARQIKQGPIVKRGGNAGSLALPVGKIWRNGRVLNVKFLGGSPKVQSKIRQFAGQWTQYANITFNWVTTGNADIRIKIDGSGGSCSFVGTDSIGIPQNQQTMNYGSFTDNSKDEDYSTVLHEFGHALGCIHEHQSPAAGIQWNRPAIYAWYKDNTNWTPEEVDINFFNTISATSTQYSVFDPSSIMIYSIHSWMTLNGFSVAQTKQLSATDKSFIAATYPFESIDNANFNTIEVRPEDPSAPLKSTKRETFSSRFASPPAIALGLNALDFGKNTNVRLLTYADNIGTTSADFHIDSWDNTELYSAGCTWFKRARDDPDFQIGQWSTSEAHGNTPQMNTAHQITFARPYTAAPKVVIWLKDLDMAKGKNKRVAAFATNITPTGFTININTWGDSILYSGAASWIAYPSNKAGVTSGTYNTLDVHPSDRPQQYTEGKVDFPRGMFSTLPNLLVAFNGFDFAGNANLRANLGAGFSKDGMTWSLKTRDDSTMYSAGASYIAFA